ncbi:hypothetical protein [Atrimonas thermophila]|uniref:hypothetical protein n=1 Tax=Atrimonas thermophila TaxID=3064161 RepID=UPI00399D51C9
MPKHGVKIKLDKERTLRYSFSALMECEEHFGKPYHQLDPTTWTLKDIAFLLATGLKHEDPEITPDNVAKLIDEAESLGYVFEKIAEAWQQAFVGKEKKQS